MRWPAKIFGPAKNWVALRSLLTALGLMLLLLGRLASAQPRPLPSAGARVAAQALFEEGRRLMQQQRYDEACAKFKESQRLDPGIGTQFNLGDCYELAGKLASAWIQFVDVAVTARAAGQVSREQAARNRVAALQPRLIRLRIEVPKPVAGLVVTRDGVVVPPPQFSTPIPVDPGTITIDATAPERVRWRKRVKARKEGKTLKVVVGPLRKAAADGSDPGKDPDRPQPRAVVVRRGASIALGALGLIAAGVGATAGAVAIDKKNESGAFCPQPDACFDEGLALRADARTAAAVSTVGFSIAAGSFIGAVVLWLSAAPVSAPPADPENAKKNRATVGQIRVLPALLPSYGGASMTISW